MENTEQAQQPIAAPVANNALPKFTDLWKQSYHFARNHLNFVGWYLGITVAVMVLFLIPIAAVFGLMESSLQSLEGVIFGLTVTVVALIAAIPALWLAIVGFTGLFYAVVSDEHDFKAGWRWAMARFWAVAWLGAIIPFVFIGGFALFVIPAIIVALYTLFYFVAFIRDDVRGLHTLALSTHLVRDRFWGVIGRLFLFSLMMTLINAAVVIIVEALNGILLMASAPVAAVAVLAVVGEVIGFIISVFLTIMMMRFMADLYAALHATKPAYQTYPYSRSYQIYRALAWFGFLLVLGGGFVLGFYLGQTENWEAATAEFFNEAVYEDDAQDYAEFEAELEALLQAELEGLDSSY